jgi:hypothetical protein
VLPAVVDHNERPFALVAGAGHGSPPCNQFARILAPSATRRPCAGAFFVDPSGYGGCRLRPGTFFHIGKWPPCHSGWHIAVIGFHLLALGRQHLNASIPELRAPVQACAGASS